MVLIDRRLLQFLISKKTLTFLSLYHIFAALAQLVESRLKPAIIISGQRSSMVEQTLRKGKVVGSSPSAGSHGIAVCS